MGVNAKIYIPSDVRMRDLEKAMGVAAGFPKVKIECGKSFYVQVEGMKIEVSNTMPECPNFVFKGYTIDGQRGHHVMFHTECTNQHGKYKLLMPPSTPFWIVIGQKMVTLFGGWMDYDDCDEKAIDFKKKKPRKYNDPEDGVEWEELQQAIWDVTPIIQTDLFAVKDVASYDVGRDVDLQAVIAKHKEEEAKRLKDVEDVKFFEEMSDKMVAQMVENID